MPLLSITNCERIHVKIFDTFQYKQLSFHQPHDVGRRGRQ